MMVLHPMGRSLNQCVTYYPPILHVRFRVSPRANSSTQRRDAKPPPLLHAHEPVVIFDRAKRHRHRRLLTADMMTGKTLALMTALSPS
jgi:hypothetical protein